MGKFTKKIKKGKHKQAEKDLVEKVNMRFDPAFNLYTSFNKECGAGMYP